MNWLLDADIEGFFDTIDHDWLIKFLEHRIGDCRILRLICKWLRDGLLGQLPVLDQLAAECFVVQGLDGFFGVDCQGGCRCGGLTEAHENWLHAD